jgi:hypothetical protein
MSILEIQNVELPTVRWAKKNGFIHAKVKFVESGWPDRLFVGPWGGLVFIEFKRPGQRPDKLQEFRMAQLAGRGILVEWFDNADDAIEFLKTLMEATRLPREGDTNDASTRERGVILGPWTGKDEHLSGGVQNIERAGPSQENVDNSSPEAGL